MFIFFIKKYIQKYEKYEKYEKYKNVFFYYFSIDFLMIYRNIFLLIYKKLI